MGTCIPARRLQYFEVTAQLITSGELREGLPEVTLLAQVVHTRCVGPQYGVILKKMLRCVDHLPLTPNEIHTASSAHGSFGDVLHQLCKHNDLEVHFFICQQPMSCCLYLMFAKEHAPPCRQANLQLCPQSRYQWLATKGPCNI